MNLWFVRPLSINAKKALKTRVFKAFLTFILRGPAGVGLLKQQQLLKQRTASLLSVLDRPHGLLIIVPIPLCFVAFLLRKAVLMLKIGVVGNLKKNK